MAGMYNLMGQFGGMFDNWQMNQYNQQMQDWRAQNQQAQAQYQADLDYWNQMNDYNQDMQSYNMWSTGASRGRPIQPTQAPIEPGWNPQPTRPRQMNFGQMFGGLGGSDGWNPTAPPGGGGGFNYGAYEGPGYQAQAGFDNQGIDTAGMVDPSSVIASAQPGIMEAMNNAFADAGNRFGSSGMVGTPYADALGAASRGAANDIANITNQYQFQAASDAANREQERAMAEYMADYNAWAQSGDWAHQGQLADMSQQFGAWGQMGDWQNQQAINDSNLANQQWMAQNDWGFQDYQNQQNMLMQFLPMMFGMMGGY
jgi:hypothetical protein